MAVRWAICCSLQIASDYADEGRGGILVKRSGMQIIIDEMSLDMILDNLVHQTGQRATRPSDTMEHGFAVCIAGKRALDPFDLPT